MIDSVYRLSTNYSIMPIEASGMLLPLCSIRWGYSNDRHSKSNTPHAHYECTQYQNITFAGSYWRATDDPRVTNRTLLSIRPSAFIFINYTDLQKQMGNAAEYKTFNGQIGKGPRNFCSIPPRLQPNSVGVSTALVTEERSPRLDWEDIHLRVCDAGRDASCQM